MKERSRYDNPVYAIVKSQGLNIRREPSRHSESIDALSRGDRVKLLGQGTIDPNWLRVLAREGRDNAVEGYAFAGDLEIIPPPPASEEDTQIFTPQPPPFFQRSRTEAIVLGLVIAAVAALLIMVFGAS